MRFSICSISRSILIATTLLFPFAFSTSARAQSVFTQKPDDARAVVFTSDKFAVKADGVTDDSAALQQAIDSVNRQGGVVLIPEGRYAISKTVFVWQGTRLIGYGAKRPVFVLGANTPGFQEGRGHYMVHFADSRPGANAPFSDASEFTFYSGMNNIDFEVGPGNPAAVCVRFHVAQHSALVHMNFNLGTAFAAMEDIGNQASDVHVTGGQYGIISKKTSPAWQFILMDSTFENQSVAGINTREVGFTLIRCSFSHMPVGIEIPAGEVEQLFARDLSMNAITTAGIKLGDDKNLRHEVTLENINCADVPHFLVGSKSIDAAGKFYAVDHVSIGLEIGADGREAGIINRHSEHRLRAAAPAVTSDIPQLPPMDQWVNVLTLGVHADGTDDNGALQAAVDKQRVLFFPAGNYRLSAPLKLRPDTILIGLQPASTGLTLAGPSDSPSGVIIAPKGGSNIVTGLSVTPGNPHAAGVLWMAGTNSMLEDVQFANRNGGGRGRGFGGPGGPGGPGGAAPETNAAPVAPDLLVTDGGGGIFRDLWAHATSSGVGLRVENTSTPGRIYQLSNEHHPRIEVQFNNVQNWDIFCLQTEEENPAGAEAYALDIENCRNLMFADTYMYRVSRNVHPKPYAVQTRLSEDIRFNNVKVFSQTRLAFDNALMDDTSGVVVRPHDFTQLVVGKAMKKPAPLPIASVFAKRATVEKVVSGFSNATSLTTDEHGRIYFTDAAEHKIYQWNETTSKAESIAQMANNLQPMVMAYVKPASLLIVTYERSMFSLNLKENALPQLINEIDAPTPDTVLMLPVGLHNGMSVMQDMMQHRGYVYRRGSNTAIISTVENEHRGYFYVPGTQTAIMSGGTGRPILQSCQLAPFAPGDRHYLTSEDDARTWLVTLEKDGKLSTQLFADRGGNSVVADVAGNVYIAGGQVYIYDRKGKQIGTLEIPERASSLAFGGPDKKTLFIAARSSIYSIQTTAAGE